MLKNPKLFPLLARQLYSRSPIYTFPGLLFFFVGKLTSMLRVKDEQKHETTKCLNSGLLYNAFNFHRFAMNFLEKKVLLRKVELEKFFPFRKFFIHNFNNSIQDIETENQILHQDCEDDSTPSQSNARSKYVCLLQAANRMDVATERSAEMMHVYVCCVCPGTPMVCVQR